MNAKLKKRICPALFALGGGLVGLVYYQLAGCATGACPITSSPVNSVIYMGVVGSLLSGIFTRGCESGCSM